MGGVPSTRYEAISAIVLFLCTAILWGGGDKPAYKNILIVLVLLYLLLATGIALRGTNGGLKFGYARLIYITVSLLFINNTFSYVSKLNFYIKILDLFILFILTLNILSLTNAVNINSLISRNYTQYLQYITDYQLSINKPILTFGVHNIAAFIYEGILLVSYYLYIRYRSKKYIAYISILLILLMLLRCSTSIAYLLFNIIIIVYNQTKSVKRLAATIVLFALALFVAFQFGLIDLYRDILGQQANGWVSRYINGIQTIFSTNIDALNKYPMGTGYCISAQENSLYGADSGFLVNFTIGSVVYTLFLYFTLFRKMLSSFNSRFIAYVAIAYLLIMELGFVTFLYYKSIAFIMVLFSLISCAENDTSDLNDM